MSTALRFTVLASYPKSGSTWLRVAMESLRNGGAGIDINRNPAGTIAAADRALFDRVTGICAADMSPRDIMRCRPHVWALLATHGAAHPWIKSHDAFLPPYVDAGLPFPRDLLGSVIYIVRDPRDVAVSFAHHFDISIDEAITCMADQNTFLDAAQEHLPKQLPQFLSSWSAHVESWLNTEGFAVHVVRYEDMHRAPTATFAGVARALGVSFTPESLESAIAVAGFQNLQAQEQAVGFGEREPHMDRFFRRGVVGGWRDTLVSAQADRICRDHEKAMSRLGYGAGS